MNQVIELTAADLHWPFEGQPYLLVGRGRWGRREVVDPFPCYSHDATLVRQILDQAQAAFSVGCPPLIYLAPFESPARTNGITTLDFDHTADGPKKPLLPWILLCGKRVPIHPAVTRYVTAHEYGHVVEDWLKWQGGLEEHDTTFLAEYAERRGLENRDRYGAGTWHLSPGEVFADDFRVFLCGVEADFWPHPGVPMPGEVPAIQSWWQSVWRDFAFVAEVPA